MNARTVTAVVSLACVALATGVAHAGVIQEAYESRTIFGYTTSGVLDQVDTYTIGGNTYTAWTRPPKVAEIDNTSGEFFFDKLNSWATGTGWSFVSAVNRLSDNSIKIRTYDVLGSSTAIGCELHVEYVPGVGDPTANVHWIQVLRTNHSLNGGYGTFEIKLDNLGSTSPYYDDMGAADGRNFYDFPARDSNLTQYHYWDAELFLATGPAPNTPGEVTLYRTGMRWGWGAVPAPGNLALLGLAGLVATKRRRTV